MISSLQSFRAVGCWSLCLLTSTSLQIRLCSARPLLHKRLLCCKHEMYSPGHSGKHLLYESHVQCRKLWSACVEGWGHRQVCVRAVCTSESSFCPSIRYLWLKGGGAGGGRVSLAGMSTVSARVALPVRAHALGSAALQSPAGGTEHTRLPH